MTATWLINRYRLVSLLQIMRPFDPKLWIEFFRKLATTEDLVAGIRNDPIQPQAVKDSWLDMSDGFSAYCSDLGMPLAAKTLAKISELLNKDDATYGQMRDLLDEFRERVHDEMEAQLFLHIASEDNRYYTDWAKGWERSLEQFPSVSTDVEEAGKSLALNRNTACVFHVMRVAEAALVSIAERVGLENSQLTGWQEAINYIEGKLNAKYEEMDQRFKGSREFLSGIAAHMRTVNLAWRRRVAHIDRNYSEEEARRIYTSTQALLQHIAEELSEESTS